MVKGDKFSLDHYPKNSLKKKNSWNSDQYHMVKGDKFRRFSASTLGILMYD